MIYIDLLREYGSLFWTGFRTTLAVSIVSLLGSLALGILVAGLRMFPIPLIAALGRIYVEFVRNIPLLLIAFFFYFGLAPFHINLDGIVAGTLALTIYTAAFIAEAIRAGIHSLPKGQWEAGYATGLSYTQILRYIVLPQAFRLVLPPLGNQFVNLVKNSSILSLIAGSELLYQGEAIANMTFKILPVYTLIAAFYLLLTLPLSQLVRYLEKRLSGRDLVLELEGGETA